MSWCGMPAGSIAGACRNVMRDIVIKEQSRIALHRVSSQIVFL